MKRFVFTLIVMAFAVIAFSQSTTIYPTFQGTEIKDYSKPGMKIEGNNIYPTYPSTITKDYSKDRYKTDKLNLERIKSHVDID